MILEWFVDNAMGFFEDVLALLPFDAVELGDITPAFALMGTFNAVLPITEMFAGAVIIFALSGVIFLVRLVQVLIAHIPWIGGAG